MASHVKEVGGDTRDFTSVKMRTAYRLENQRSPVARASPWPIVFVAVKPKAPPAANKPKARR